MLQISNSHLSTLKNINKGFDNGEVLPKFASAVQFSALVNAVTRISPSPCLGRLELLNSMGDARIDLRDRTNHIGCPKYWNLLTTSPLYLQNLHFLSANLSHFSWNPLFFLDVISGWSLRQPLDGLRDLRAFRLVLLNVRHRSLSLSLPSNNGWVSVWVINCVSFRNGIVSLGRKFATSTLETLFWSPE